MWSWKSVAFGISATTSPIPCSMIEAKKRGVQLGKNGKVLAEQRRKEAAERAEALRSVVQPMIEQGLSMGEIARRLNQSGIVTATGKAFHTQQVISLVQRLG